MFFLDFNLDEAVDIIFLSQGRVDDNTETIQKRLKVYFESTLPVIDYYDSKGKVQKVS